EQPRLRPTRARAQERGDRASLLVPGHAANANRQTCSATGPASHDSGSDGCQGRKLVARSLRMKVRLLTVSHKQPAWVLEGCADYQRRLPREWGFQLVEVKPEARTAGATRERVHAAECKRIREALPKGSLVVAFDERGESWSTLELGRRLQRW